MSKGGKRGIKRFFVTAYLLAIHLLAALFVFNYLIAPYINKDNSYLAQVSPPATNASPVPTIIPVPSIEPTPTIAEVLPIPEANANTQIQRNFVQPSAPADVLMIPVVGVKKSQLTDTFSDARSEGRVHNAIDIMAPAGTPVVAAADGEIVRFWDSAAGGITIYQYSADKTRAYYYAHLQSRAPNIKEKDFVKRGTVIGYVGDTGNSGAGNFHLHFSITVLTDQKNVFEGESINPFPILASGIEAR